MAYTKPHFVVLQSSNSKKISLHIINKSVKYHANQREDYKVFLSKFSEYLIRHSTTISGTCLDTAMSSRNHLFRLVGNSKVNDPSRRLTVCPECNEGQVKLVDTLVTIVSHDGLTNDHGMYSTVNWRSMTSSFDQALDRSQGNMKFI